LLPAFDPLLVGYQSRDWLAVPAVARRIHPGGGVIRPTLLVEGAAAGVWRQRRGKTRLEVAIETSSPLPAGTLARLEEEVADLGRFLAIPARLAPPATTRSSH
jgi:hypothetical protein